MSPDPTWRRGDAVAAFLAIRGESPPVTEGNDLSLTQLSDLLSLSTEMVRDGCPGELRPYMDAVFVGTLENPVPNAYAYAMSSTSRVVVVHSACITLLRIFALIVEDFLPGFERFLANEYRNGRSELQGTEQNLEVVEQLVAEYASSASTAARLNDAMKIAKIIVDGGIPTEEDIRRLFATYAFPGLVTALTVGGAFVHCCP